ncbi:NifU family protein [Sinomicrobium kalidii]|uniref:NifU family protein n=1 Tax=Sinomicrobium kalidii TaxID=2900738 RepID=UPI001E474ABF|nr:NifU family protein [Sinomicrobium kalidii]UGU14845.1 NifU family protein [Sinomicrobium kalidii]
MEKTVIKIKPTNNPSIIKFEADKFLTEHQSFEFKNIDEAGNSPLAQQLFYLPFVKTVFISGNFVAVERYNIVEWEEVQTEVADQIEHYLNSGQPVVKTAEKDKKLPYTIYAESTPNPAVMKFVANKKLVDSIFEFKNIDEAKEAPLAQALFHFPFVKEVFFDENYISITKYDIAEWNDITMELREYIRIYLEEGKTIITEGIEEQKTNKNAIANTQQAENLNETSKQIISIIEEYVKPAVASDGGNILFESYDENSKIVKLILQGACSGCPSSTITLKNGIETMLKEMMHGKINEVVAING